MHPHTLKSYCILPFTGWYRATDTVEVKFDVEEGAHYQYVVKDEVKARRLKLAKDTQKKVDDYENIFQIGAVIEVRWSDDDVVETEVGPGTLYNVLCI